MNRPIKFRAWGINSKEFLHDQLGHGLTLKEIQNIEAIDLWEFSQFTGLLDKNGKEIYEGDILKDDVGDILEVKFGKLPLNKSGDCVCTFPAFYCKNYGQLGKSPMYECQEIGEWMEIIGNIYSNPDLLTTPTK